MNTCRVFVPYGALGTGIAEESFDAGVRMKPDVIACDAGSTDSGPYYLGTGEGKYARDSVKEDLRRMVKGGALAPSAGSGGQRGNLRDRRRRGRACGYLSGDM